MNRLFRFFQPIGCALLTLALLDTICNSFWLLLQYTSLEHKYFRGETATQDFWKNILWNFLIVLRFLLSIVLWSAILLGKNAVLVFWIGLSFLTDCGTVAFVLTEKLVLRGSTPPDYTDTTSTGGINIWGIITLEDPWPIFISLGIFVLLRLYLLLVGVQGCLCLHRKYDVSRNRSLAEDISDIEVCLEPIGYGFQEVWAFLKDFPGMGAVILLTTEMIWNTEHLGLRELFVFMLEKAGKALLLVETEKDVLDYVFLEDNVLRGIRIFLAFVGIYFINKEHLNFVRLWILVYFISLISSNVIFAITVTIKDISWIVFHAISHIFDNLLRLFVLYYSFKFAIVHRQTFRK
ncbi:uncharacterized protein LOC110858594 [Folsomia candida]|uniref:uncharacterized protein LOC110858594 n=1 Tax=Folsomia candida TaxID=158441 RepID=UPI000B8FD264|nr:uncharacterized protein LOC110858594 [Folsomia candida]